MNKSNKNQNSEANIETTVVHAGVSPDPVYGAVMTPIFQTSTYAQKSPGQPAVYDYSRGGNPTRTALEESLAALEGAKFAFSWASGLAAAQAVIQLLEPGAHILVSEDGYGGTGRLFRNLFARYQFNFEFVDFRQTKEVIEKINSKTKLIWLESPTNPLMRLADIAAISEKAKAAGALTVVDNTFASPIFQTPLKLGADIVLHSTTKYIGGHSDLIGGALMLNNSELAEKLKFIQFAAGAVNAPFEAFLLLRSIKTLSVRMQKHQENAMKVAHALEEISDFETVLYPGLKSHPQHDLALKQMKGFSGVVSVRLQGGQERVNKFLSGLKIITLAESLGGVESLINHPLTMTHASVPEPMRQKLGITPDLLRISIGIENADDLIADIKEALR